jgi:transposase
VANECLRIVREDAKVQRLRQQADAKRQQTIEEHGKPKPPALILHLGDNRQWLKGKQLFEVCLTDPPYELDPAAISHAAATRASINPKPQA